MRIRTELMDQTFTRGAAVAAFTLGTLAAFGSAGAQVAAGAVRPLTRDSVVVRVIGGDQKMLIDSLMVITRALDSEAPTSEQAVRLRRELETMMRALAMSGRGRGVQGGIMLRATTEGIRDLEARHIKGWIGINTGMAPHEEFADSASYFVRYFKYPEIISVEPNSPAQRAGIIPGDVLVAYDGNDVVSRRIDVGQLLVPDRRMAVTVQREGESKEFSMVVAKAPMRITFRRNDDPGEPFPMAGELRAGGAGGGTWTRGVPMPARPDQPERVLIVGGVQGGAGVGSGDVRYAMPFSFGPNGVLGALLMTVTPEFARVSKLREGVVIQDCPEDSPAYRGGLRTGDAIVSVGGQAVTRTTDVRSVLYAKRNERATVFQVLRNQKSVTLTVKW
jgi:membrane-associated protease RseP (regulator of RpoE activity)